MAAIVIPVLLLSKIDGRIIKLDRLLKPQYFGFLQGVSLLYYDIGQDNIPFDVAGFDTNIVIWLEDISYGI
jgi:hypothetical protein